MVIVNNVAGINNVPAWLQHAPGAGLTFVDVIAPAFLFAIGLTYGVSLQRRRDRDGGPAATGHFLKRWFALIGIGAILSAGEGFTGVTGNVPVWGVLQAIGVAGLLTLPVLRRPAWIRLTVACVLLALYQVGHDLLMADSVVRSSHGGLWGSVAWTAALILSTIFADGAHGRRKPTADVGMAVGLIAAGLLLSRMVPVAKQNVSASYVLISVGISALVYQLLRLTADVAGARIPPFVWWGRNPLLLYILHQFLRALIVLPGVDWWYTEASPVLLTAQVASTLGVLTLISWWLYRKRAVVSL
jgi:predicted acyltransferase